MARAGRSNELDETASWKKFQAIYFAGEKQQYQASEGGEIDNKSKVLPHAQSETSQKVDERQQLLRTRLAIGV
eukprot:6186161-Pleurochrysis_carterae.AAC.1